MVSLCHRRFERPFEGRRLSLAVLQVFRLSTSIGDSELLSRPSSTCSASSHVRPGWSLTAWKSKRPWNRSRPLPDFRARRAEGPARRGRSRRLRLGRPGILPRRWRFQAGFASAWKRPGNAPLRHNGQAYKRDQHSEGDSRSAELGLEMKAKALETKSTGRMTWRSPHF